MLDKQKNTWLCSYISTHQIFFNFLICILFILIYVLRLDHVSGMYVDDAWYILLGKAIATGKGYAMINSPTPGLLPPLYPPAFPFLLSLVFRIAPDFPQNVFLLKMVSVLAMIGVGIVSYQYCKLIKKMPKKMAFGVASAVFLSPWAVLLTTSMVMSDSVFMLSSLLIIFLVELIIGKKNQRYNWIYVVCISSLMAFTFLTRSIAIGLIIAALFYLLTKYMWAETIICLATFVLLIAPWVYYASAHAVPPEQLQEQNGYVTQNYKNHFFSKKASVTILGRESISDLPYRVWRNTKFLASRAIGEIIFPGNLYEVVSGDIARIVFLQLVIIFFAVGFISISKRQVSLSEVYVFISLTMFAVWPFQETRYLLPLLPFLILYVLEAMSASLNLIIQKQELRRLVSRNTVLTILLWGVVAVYIFEHVKYIYDFHTHSKSQPIFIKKYEESEKIVTWINQNIPKDQVIATDNPPLLYLLTGNKTISSDELLTICSEPVSSRQYWDKLNVRYVVGPWVPPYFLQFTNHSLIYKPKGSAYLTVAEIVKTEQARPVNFLPAADQDY